jgi:hypothetical protein
MCPACIATTALMLTGVISTGGLTALAARLLNSKNDGNTILSEKPKRKEQ